ncbi:MAG: DUF559 domain-containing protein [Cyanobacteria bacterium P01_A01_bin.105]
MKPGVQTWIYQAVWAEGATPDRPAYQSPLPRVVRDPTALNWLPQRTLTHWLNPLPQQTDLVAGLARQLATVALQLWPTWYGQTDLFYDSNHTTDTLLNRFACLDQQANGMNLPWLQRAVQRSVAGQLPLLSDFPMGLQLRQLALAIEPKDLGIAIALTDPHPREHCLLALTKTLPWLAEHTQAQVALLIPHTLADAPALAPLLYQARRLTAPTPPTLQESPHQIYPIAGRPHPFSPGEQKLAQRLAQDGELASLFHCNQPVHTVKHSRYLVDLLWAAGRVVVEVDGYRYHGHRHGFSQDRQRDYELLVSGYIVLRLPHDEVIDDVEIAVEKIRDVVRFRRSGVSEDI